MANYHILFGFRQEEMELKIVNMIKKKGHDVIYAERDSKESIRAYLSEHKDCTCAVLREGMGEEAYSAEDFAELTDERDINIVAIVEGVHKGTDYMQTLYGAGITSAILVSNKVGAFPADIARLLMQKRTRKQARKVYGIIGNKIKLDVITYESYLHYYTKLVNADEGLNIIDRYLSIVRELSVKQAADFTKKLPIELRRELTRYEEFHVVLDSMRRQGVMVNIKKPDNVKKGLTEEEFLRAIGKRETKAKKVSAEVIVPEMDMQKESTGNSQKEKPLSSEAVAESEENVFFQEQLDEEKSLKDIETVSVDRDTNVSSAKNDAPASVKNEMPKQTAKKQTQKKPSVKNVNTKEKTGGIRWKYVLITFFMGLVLLGLWYVFLMFG